MSEPGWNEDTTSTRAVGNVSESEMESDAKSTCESSQFSSQTSRQTFSQSALQSAAYNEQSFERYGLGRGFKRRTEQMTDSSDKKTPCSTPHRKQFKKDSHPVDYVSIALQRSKIPENFQFLFQLYGVYQVEDLKELGLQAIQDIENSVSTDSFPKVDFTSRSAQIKHLGYQLGQTSSGQTKPYKIEPLIRRRILEELPKVLDSVIKEKAEYENFRNKILKPNTINISSFTYPEQDSQGDSVFAVEESLSTGLSSLPQSEDFSNSCSNPSSLANNNLNQDDESQLAILGPSSSRVGENKKGFSNTLRHKAPEIQLLGGPSRDGSDQDTTSTLNEFGKKVWTHQELSELGANLALKGVVKIKEFWSMTSHGTLHGGKEFNVSDVLVEVKQETVSVLARCLVCSKFIKLNIVSQRACSIINYKQHCMRHVQVNYGYSKAVQSGVQNTQSPTQSTSSDSFLSQPKILNFFKRTTPSAVQSAVITEETIGYKTPDKTQIEEEHFAGFDLEFDGEFDCGNQFPLESKYAPKKAYQLEDLEEDGSEVIESELTLEQITVQAGKDGTSISIVDFPGDIQNLDSNVPKLKQGKNKILVSKQLQLTVSLHHFKSFKPAFTFDPTQTSIIDYLLEATKDGLLIARLIASNKELRQELADGKINPVVCSPTFHQEIIEIQKQKLTKKNTPYGENVKDVCLLYFLAGGRKVYEMMSKNMPVPSMSTIYKFLYDKKASVEARFCFEEAKKTIQENKDVNYVWVSEDDTKIVQGIRYNPQEDTVVGLCLPINPQTGCPRTDFFKFTSIKDVTDYLFNYKLATYAKLIALKPLNKGSKTVILVLYGTNGSDNADQTLSRWNFILEKLHENGIYVMGFSSDGAAAFLKAMLTLTSLTSNEAGSQQSMCPAEFNGFFQAEWDLNSPCVINDSVHLVVKIIWRMMKKNMNMGDSRVSKANILDMLLVYGKAKTGVDPSVITDLKDAMNYERATKLCAPKIYELLDNEDQKATRTFLKLATNVNLALVDTSLSPEERIPKLWYSVFLCRFWRLSTLSTRGKTLKNDFLSDNAYKCLEINAHNLLKFLVQCRDMGKPELFLPYEANSQTCESVFRGLRSQGTSNYTVVNFNMSEILYRARRAAKIVQIQSSIDPSFHTFETSSLMRKLRKQTRFVPTQLPSNLEIKILVDAAFREALQDAAALGISVESFIEQNFFDVVSYPPHGLSTSTNQRNNEQETHNLDNETLGEVPGEVHETQCSLDLNQELDIDCNNQISEHEVFLGDVLGTDFVEDLSEPPPPRGFVKVQGKVGCLRKSFVLWSLLQKQEKLSQDRLRRFIDVKKKVMRKADFISIAQFIKMSLQLVPSKARTEEYLYVVGFRALTGNKLDIPNVHMPLKTLAGKVNASIGALVNLYRLEKDGDGTEELVYANAIKEPISLKHFIRHVENIELFSLFPN